MLRRLTAACAALALAACGTVGNKTGVETLAPGALGAADRGIVVLSAGAPERCVSQATFLSLREAASGRVIDSVPSIGVDVYVHKSDFEGHHGTVNAFALPPGSYRLTPSIANPYVRTVSAPTFDFDVKPGETTYVGELFMTKACALNTSFEVRDRFERDMALAAKKNPAIAGRAAVKRLLRDGARAGGG